MFVGAQVYYLHKKCGGRCAIPIKNELRDCGQKGGREGAPPRQLYENCGIPLHYKLFAFPLLYKLFAFPLLSVFHSRFLAPLVREVAPLCVSMGKLTYIMTR